MPASRRRTEVNWGSVGELQIRGMLIYLQTSCNHNQKTMLELLPFKGFKVGTERTRTRILTLTFKIVNHSQHLSIKLPAVPRRPRRPAYLPICGPVRPCFVHMGRCM